MRCLQLNAAFLRGKHISATLSSTWKVIGEQMALSFGPTNARFLRGDWRRICHKARLIGKKSGRGLGVDEVPLPLRSCLVL
jgi:hypothetical protein